jgi:methyl-accepting chemotaxis protein
VKRTLWRIAGTVAVTVGLAGIVLSTAAVVQVWKTAGALEREIPQALANLEDIVNSVHQQGATTVALLGTAREHVAFIGTSVEDLSNRARERPAVTILETLDEDIGWRLDNAEEFVLSMQISMRSMSSALLVLDSLPFFAPRLASTADPQQPQLRSVATSLTETADLLDQVSRAIERARSGQAIAPNQLVQLQETLRRVDDRLEAVQNEIGEFSQRVEQTGEKLAALRRDVPRWINSTALVATVFFVCFGFSQLSLVLHGCRWVSQPGSGRAGG